VKELGAVKAYGHIHHALVLALQLMVASRSAPALTEQ
jgi:hypothetical protein